MRRSEMIEQIELFITECNRDGFTLSETSECLLDFLEGCGMFPPYSGSDPFYSSRLGALNDCVWEEEDD